jgi:peroxiredoxin
MFAADECSTDRRIPMHIQRHFLTLAAALWTVSASADIPSDPAQVHPLAVGMRAPTFSAQTKDGVLRTFSPDGYQKPTVVIFYRGGWCPYCNMQLSDPHLVEPKLRQSGFEVVFLSTDRPAILYSSLKSEHIDYTLLSDSRLEAAEAFHIAFHLDDATIAKMNGFGVDLDSTTGEPLHELPVPSVFIIDRTGTIRYVYSNPDFKVRLGADALWAAATPYATK